MKKQTFVVGQIFTGNYDERIKILSVDEFGIQLLSQDSQNEIHLNWPDFENIFYEQICSVGNFHDFDQTGHCTKCGVLA